MGEGGETGSRGHLSVQFGGRHGSQESSPSGMWSALEVVSHCPGLQGSSTELLRNNVGLGLRLGLFLALASVAQGLAEHYYFYKGPRMSRSSRIESTTWGPNHKATSQRN
jgi:hypothetical protein